jgi:pilus assembly protein CpaB
MAVAGFAFLSSATKKSDVDVPKEQILATSVELSAGTLLRAQDITWKPVVTVEADEIARPSTTQIQVKPDIVEETAAGIYGAVLRHPLIAGAPIHRGDIVKPGDRDFLQVVLPPGARAIAIPVATGGASTGILTPGDHVDVILTQNFKRDLSNDDARNTPLTRRSVGETVVQNLRVLAIDTADTKASGIGANPATGNFGRTVTLEVTPEQAETINVAAELGKLSVTLRSTNQVAGIEPSVKAKWAGDVSPALLNAASPKPTALKPLSLTIFRGGHIDKELRE